MKGVIALLASLYSIFMITAIITHLWTVIIAFQEAGFWGCLLTLFLPFLSELYWMIKMFGENNLYAYIALIHLALAFVFAFFMPRENR
jgi:hypothetical protein